MPPPGRALAAKGAAVTALIVLSVTLAGCLSSQERPANKVVIGHLISVTQPEIFIAVDKGYLAEEFGADVTVERRWYNDGNTMLQAMQNGEIDLALAGSVPAIVTFSKWPHLRIVGGTNIGGTVLVARNASGISSVADLGGKTVAVPTQFNFQDVVLRAVILRGAGLVAVNGTPGPYQVKVITSAPPDMIVKLKEGSADAVLTFEPWGARILANATVPSRLVLDWREVWHDGAYPSSVLVATDAFIQGHHGWLLAYLRAHVRAAEFAIEHPAEVPAILDARFKADSGSSPGLSTVASAYNRTLPTWNPSVGAVLEFADLAHSVYPEALPNPEDTVKIFALADLYAVLGELGLPGDPWS